MLKWYLSKTQNSSLVWPPCSLACHVQLGIDCSCGFAPTQGYGFPVSQLFDMLLEMREQYGEILLKRWNITFRYALSCSCNQILMGMCWGVCVCSCLGFSVAVGTLQIACCTDLPLSNLEGTLSCGTTTYYIHTRDGLWETSSSWF